MIYLDNSATTYPKPDIVYKTAQRAMKKYGANPSRSAHSFALASGGAVYGVREKLCAFFNLNKPENVIFTLNTTHALNLAIHSAVKENSVVITDAMEHNSVLRPLYKLSDEGICSLRFFAPDMHNVYSTINAFKEACEGCDVAVITACSNVNGYRMPIYEIGKICREKGITLIVDGAQGAGYFNIDMQKCCIDMLCVPGHKGLYSLMGCGALLVNESFEDKTQPLITGGSGNMSKNRQMPPYLPERLEAGTLPCLPIITLGAGIDFINLVGLSEINYRTYTCAARCRELLKNIKGVNVYSSFGSIVLFNVQNIQSDEAASYLNDCGIALRSGLHCAPLAHEFLSTQPDGALRASFGAFNSPRDADKLAGCLQKIKKV